MKAPRLLSSLIAWLLVLPVFSALAQSSSTNLAEVDFRAADIFLDSKDQPLAAYQFEFSVIGGDARIVSIEGGEGPAFSEPPFYDPRAMQHERVILAAFSTNAVAQLPTGKTRVATIHFQIHRAAEPEFQLTLQAAADSNGNRIPAETSAEERRTK